VRVHILPARFVKIRHYGLLGNRNRAERIARVRTLIGSRPCAAPMPLESADSQTATDSPPPRTCPYCGSRRIALVARREPLRRQAPPVQPVTLNSS
jgi:hypothetical protein